MRRTLTIVAIAIVVFGVAVLVYFMFFSGSGAGLVVDTGASTGNPFGSPGGDTSGPSTDSSTSSVDSSATPIAGTQIAPHLLKITPGPVARGFLVLNASTTAPVALASTTVTAPARNFSTEVRYVARESGNMYSYNLTEGTSVRLTNHTAPGVQETSWANDGSVAFIRFLTIDTDKTEHIDTYALPGDGSDGRLLARDLSEVLTQGTNTLFTLMPSTSGSLGVISKPDGSVPTTLFSSSLSALQLFFSGTNLVAYTKPSADLSGYAFLVDRKTGSFSKFAGPFPGLTVLPSPSGKQMLLSYLAQGILSLKLFDATTRITSSLPVSTLSEKCVWAPDGESAYCAVPVSLEDGLPDTWYRGTVSFSDRIWKIDLVARAALLVADLPQLSKDPVDAVSLTLDRNESTLVFMNKRDGSLWAYSL